jgi:hypothetical protein
MPSKSKRRAKNKARAKSKNPGKRRGNKPAAVHKGGDGGTYVKRKRKRFWKANGQVYVTGLDIRDGEALGAFLASLVETKDKCDRAHNKKRLIVPGLPEQSDDSWTLVPLCELTGRPGPLPGRLRRYHPSQMTSRGVAFDSMYDHVALVTMYYRAQGIELGMRTMHGRHARSEHDRAIALSGLSVHEARAMTQQRTDQELTAEERSLEDQATELIERADKQKGTI